MQVKNKRTYSGPGKYVGRPSVLGNRYVIGRDGDRHTVVRKYALWIWDRLHDHDPQVIAALEALNEDDVLICWCAPAECHATIIDKAWHWARDNGFTHPLTLSL